MKCQYCQHPNEERWFYCRACGERTSESSFTTNMFMVSEIGRRSDIEFSSIDVESHMNSILKNRELKQQNFWKEKVNAIR